MKPRKEAKRRRASPIEQRQKQFLCHSDEINNGHSSSHSNNVNNDHNGSVKARTKKPLIKSEEHIDDLLSVSEIYSPIPVELDEKRVKIKDKRPLTFIHV